MNSHRKYIHLYVLASVSSLSHSLPFLSSPFLFLICFSLAFFHFCTSPHSFLSSFASPSTISFISSSISSHLPLPLLLYLSLHSPPLPSKPLPTFLPLLLYLIFYLSPSPSHAVKSSPARSSQPLACLGLTTANNPSFTCRSSKQLGYSLKLTYTTCFED